MRPAPDLEAARALALSLKIPLALGRLLCARGIGDAGAAKAHLRPLVDHFHPPELLPDISIAAKRLIRAIERRESILVHGDFDADGICATALLTEWINELGGRARAFVPDRIRDGYDFGGAGLKEAARARSTLIVTVDCGVTALETVERARAQGIDVIVTDHHQVGEALPRAVAVVNPCRADSAYPNPELCGAAVAFKLGQLLSRKMGRPDEEAWSRLDLAGIATITDLVRLSGENRAIARIGLRAVGQTERAGLKELLRQLRIKGPATAADAGFRIGPHLNAVGRTGNPMDAVRLLLSNDKDEARRLVAVLKDCNLERRRVEGEVYRSALDRLSDEFEPERDFAVVLAGEGWHPGVVGIVASRVVERTYRPTVILSVNNGVARGSARSIAGFHLHQALTRCGEHLERFGGHAMAAGMTLKADKIASFREGFQAVAARTISREDLAPTITADLEVTLDEVGPDFYRYARYTHPHGAGNRAPVYVARGVSLAEQPRVSSKGHLFFTMLQGDASMDAVGFKKRALVESGVFGTGPVDVLFLAEEHYQRKDAVRAKILDARPAK